MRHAPAWRTAAALLAAVVLVSCDSDDPGILGVGDELGRTALRVEITPGSVLIPWVGARDTLSASVLTTAGGTASGFTVNWRSLNGGVVTVDESGILESRSEGTAEIVASIQNLSDTAVVTVTRLPASVAIPSDDLLFAQIGSTALVNAQVFDALGQPLDSAVSWSSSNSGVASVSSSGMVTAISEGFATISAVARNARAQLEVEVDTGVAVLEVDVESIELDALEATAWVDVSAEDVLGTPVQADYEYSVTDSNIAEILGDTTLIARSEGETTLTVRVSGTSLTRTIPVVVDQRAVAVNVYQDRVGTTAALPDTDTLESFVEFDAPVEAFDANGFTFTPDSLDVSWSNSDGEVLDLYVDSTRAAMAIIQTLTPGTSTVVAELDGAADSLTLTVEEPAGLTLEVVEDTLRLFPGESRTVRPVFSSDAETDLCCGQAVWTTSDAEVATVAAVSPATYTVEPSVFIDAQGPGTAWITATRGDLQDSVFVQVTQQGFNITVIGSGQGSAQDELALISAAATHWEEILTGDLPDVSVQLEGGACEEGIGPLDRMVDDLLLVVVNGGTPSVGPCVTRSAEDGGLPAVAFVSFDAATLTGTGSGEALARHLVGHALGIGTIDAWQDALDGLGSDPHFTGPAAVAAFRNLPGDSEGATPVPVQDDDVGDPWADYVHWSEATLGIELMTGAYVSGVDQSFPLSSVTAGALTDLGYEVTPFRLDGFSLTPPPGLEGAATTVFEEAVWPAAFRLTADGEVERSAAPPR